MNNFPIGTRVRSVINDDAGEVVGMATFIQEDGGVGVLSVLRLDIPLNRGNFGANGSYPLVLVHDDNLRAI